MPGFRFRVVVAIAMTLLLASLLRAQLSQETLGKANPGSETSESADETPAPSPRPKASKAKAKATPSPTPEKSPSAKGKKKATKEAADEEASPTPKKSAAPKKATGGTKKKAAHGDEEKAQASESAADEATPEANPKVTKRKATPKPSPGKKQKGSKGKAAAKKKKVSGEEKTAGKMPASPTDGTSVPRATKVPSGELPSETPSPPRAAPVPQRAGAAATPSLHPPLAATVAPGQQNYDDSAQLTIEKTGYEEKRGFWSRLFGGGGGGGSRSGSRYVTGSVRAEIDRAPADRRNPPWQYIVVHNSGTRQGNARVFDYYHKRVRRMQNGLAYHFVIGNGTSTGNGQIEVGERWRRQINGGHVHSDHLNNIGLGICLVGDFNRQQPTRAQLESCEELIRYLRQRCRGSGRHLVVKPHRAMNPPRWATDCPGDVFPYSWFKRF